MNRLKKIIFSLLSVFIVLASSYGFIFVTADEGISTSGEQSVQDTLLNPKSPTDQKWFTFNQPNTISRFNQVIDGENAPLEIVIPSTYIDNGGNVQDVLYIESNAFSGNQTITKLIIPDSIMTSGSSAFKNCTQLEEVVLGNSLIEISTEMFRDCTKLSKITYGNSVETIGSNAFINCAFKEMIIPDQIKSIGIDAFRDCNQLTTLDIGKGITELHGFQNTGLKSVVIPDNVVTIKKFAFSNCSKLTSMIIGKGVKTIEDLSFTMSGLENIDIPDNVTTIGEWSFAFCENMKTLTLGKGVRVIEKLAFSKTGIRKIIIPDTVTTIKTSAFSGSQNLNEIVLGNGLETIENDAFFGCAINTMVKIPNSVTNIAGSAFNSNPNITRIVVDNLRSNCAFSVDAPWGATNATVYYQDEYIDMDYTLEKNGYQRNVNYTFTSKNPTLTITKIALPDGTSINVNNQSNYSGTYVANQNDDFTFSVFTNGGTKIDHKVEVRDIGKIDVTTNDIVIRKSVIDTFSLGDFMQYSKWSAKDIDKNVNLPIIIDKTMDQIKSELLNNGDQTVVNISIANDFGTTINRNIVIKIDETIPLIRFVDENNVLKETCVNFGQTIDNFTPTKNGAMVSQWYTDTSLQNAWSFDTAINTDLTLYAKWNWYTYTIIYDTNMSDVVVPNKSNVTVKDADLLPVINKAGYSVSNWKLGNRVITKDTALGEIISSLPNGSLITLHAQWTLNNYTITYNTGFDDITVSNKENVTLNNKKLIPDNLTKVGYTFLGWKNEDKEVTSSTKLESLLTNQPDGSVITLTAQWQRNQYQVEYVFVGDIPSNIEKPNIVSIDHNETLIQPSTMLLKDYVFSGWYTDKNCNKVYDFSKGITENMTLYGKWRYVKSEISNTVDKEIEKEEIINVKITGKIGTDKVSGKIDIDILKDYIKIYGHDGSQLSYNIISSKMNEEAGTYDVVVQLENGETRTISLEIEENNNILLSNDNVGTSQKSNISNNYQILITISGYLLYVVFSIYRVYKKNELNKQVKIGRSVTTVLALILITILYIMSNSDLVIWFYVPSVALIVIATLLFTYQNNLMKQ